LYFAGVFVPDPRPKPPAGGIKAKYPGFIEPALATSISKAPTGERWIREVKFDGYRGQMHVINEPVRIFTIGPTASRKS
jgi:bifunctional non-homologous end joining protein LigD